MTGLLAGAISLSVAVETDAASREEIAAINVEKASDFKYWNDDSPTKAKIVSFVEDAINPASENFIPIEDRIATFDSKRFMVTM